jgi:hypothetical protein
MFDSNKMSLATKTAFITLVRKTIAYHVFLFHTEDYDFPCSKLDIQTDPGRLNGELLGENRAHLCNSAIRSLCC